MYKCTHERFCRNGPLHDPKVFTYRSCGGTFLVLAACLALILANGAGSDAYHGFLSTQLSVVLDGNVGIDKPVLLWINDGLMAIFFLLVGLEIKREVLEGELSSRKKALMPGIAAIGGMVGPAAVFVLFNIGYPAHLAGWAIPAATDIAFALGVMALLGPRVPTNLKVFLLALAVMDDLGAIIIIALFYTSQLSLVSLAFAGFAITVLFALNQSGVCRITPYILVGIFLWVCVLKSGVHATLAGVILGIAIPLHGKGTSPLKKMEEALHPWVAFGIMPLFAFANAGVPLSDVTIQCLYQPHHFGCQFRAFHWETSRCCRLYMGSY